MKKKIINTIITAMLGASMLTGCGAPAEKAAETVKKTEVEASADKADTVFKHENNGQLEDGRCPLENVKESQLKKADENREAMSKYLDLDKKMYLIANGKNDITIANFITLHQGTKSVTDVAINGLIIDKDKYRAAVPESRGTDVTTKDAKLPVNDIHAFFSIAIEDNATNDLVIQKDLIFTFSLIDEKMAEELAGKEDCVIVNADGTVYGETE